MLDCLTVITGHQGDGGASFSLSRLQNRQVTSTERNLQTAVRTMNGIGERLGLVDSIKTRAAQVFQEVRGALQWVELQSNSGSVGRHPCKRAMVAA